MKEAIQLTKINFDNLENRNGESVEFTKIFVGDGGYTAYYYLSKWFGSQPPEQRYVGWNHQVYPKYKIESMVINK